MEKKYERFDRALHQRNLRDETKKQQLNIAAVSAEERS